MGRQRDEAGDAIGRPRASLTRCQPALRLR
jgi:hypothetical protein